MLMLIYERVKITQYLRVLNRYRDRLVFVGRLNVLMVLLMGIWGYWYPFGTKFHDSILEGLMAILTTAKLNLDKYKVVNWFQLRDRFILYVIRETR